MNNFLKLPKRIKTKWIKALRGDKYTQTDGSLYTGINEKGQMECCCLGVLEHECGTPLPYLKGEGYTRNLTKPNSPKEIRELVHYRGQEDRLEGILGKYNDGKGGFAKHSFTWIANWIEKNL